MALKGFESHKESNGPTVHVTVRQPKDEFSIGRGTARRNPVERFEGWGWVPWALLGGVIVGVALLRKPRDIGALNTKSGIGDVARFQIDDDNADRVKAVVGKFMDRAKRDINLRNAVGEILRKNQAEHGAFRSQWQVAETLHSWVNGPQFPVKADPDGFESIVSPEELMARWLNGTVESLSGLDCDDKALFLAAVAYHAGIESHICLLDTDQDGKWDHAGTFLVIDGKEVFAETVVPGKPLGWKPPSAGRDCIVS